MDEVSDPLLKHLTAHRLGYVKTDYYLARRQRLHLGWIPSTDERFESPQLVDVLAWLVDQGCPSAVIVPGRVRRPAMQFWVTLMPVPPLRASS